MQLPELSEIGRLREKLGLTQSELAKKSGVSQSLIARIEAGDIDPGYSNVARIFRALSELEDIEITAKEIMTPRVHGIQLGNTMETAAKKMKKHDVSQMPVFDGDRIVGSISERVILDQITRGMDASDLSRKKVDDYLEGAFPTVSPETPLSSVSALLEHNSAVIVLEKGIPRGIITNSDLLKMVHG